MFKDDKTPARPNPLFRKRGKLTEKEMMNMMDELESFDRTASASEDRKKRTGTALKDRKKEGLRSAHRKRQFAKVRAREKAMVERKTKQIEQARARRSAEPWSEQQKRERAEKDRAKGYADALMIHEEEKLSVAGVSKEHTAVMDRLQNLDPKTKIDLVEEIRSLTLEKQRAVRAANDMRRSLTHERRIKRKVEREMSKMQRERKRLLEQLNALKEERRKERVRVECSSSSCTGSEFVSAKHLNLLITRQLMKMKQNPLDDRKKRQLEQDLLRVRSALQKSVKEQAQVLGELDARESRIRSLERRVQELKTKTAVERSRIPQPRVENVQKETLKPTPWKAEIEGLRDEVESWRLKYNELERKRSEEVGG